MSALASELPRRNGWTIGRACRGPVTPDRMQRLLNRASWDAAAAMSEVRRFAAAGLDKARGAAGGGAVLVIAAIDETGQEKTGEATAGVKRQYMGCAGRVANGINTVHVSLIREKTGHALIGARQWIAREQIEDPVTSLVMGLPPVPGFRTKCTTVTRADGVTVPVPAETLYAVTGIQHLPINTIYQLAAAAGTPAWRRRGPCWPPSRCPASTRTRSPSSAAGPAMTCSASSPPTQPGCRWWRARPRRPPSATSSSRPARSARPPRRCRACGPCSDRASPCGPSRRPARTAAGRARRRNLS